MSKPRTIGGYDEIISDGCERVLVTLLRGLGPWKDSLFLIGGLTPRYLIKARPPKVPRHAGTGDVDLVVNLSVLTDTKAYNTLEANLAKMGFHRVVNDEGRKVSWRWQARIEEGVHLVIEFLADDPSMGDRRVEELPTKGKVSAVNIPHASMVFDLHHAIEVTADLLDGEGRASETIRYADIISFTCLKAFAYDDRQERKDAHDLVYCLEHYDGGLAAVHEAFDRALEGEHGPVIRKALALLAGRFCDPVPDDSYLRDGPVAVARFEDDDVDVAGDENLRNARILRQRNAAGLMEEFLAPYRDRRSVDEQPTLA